MRVNPGPFEPLVYFLQTPAIFRLLGLGGHAVFAILTLLIATRQDPIYGAIFLILLAGFWYESSISVCRRCRFYGTWHCLGQGMLVSRLFARVESGLSELRMHLHGLLLTIVALYELFWLWHRPTLGLLFTLWLPLAFISATTPRGWSWRANQST